MLNAFSSRIWRVAQACEARSWSAELEPRDPRVRACDDEFEFGDLHFGAALELSHLRDSDAASWAHFDVVERFFEDQELVGCAAVCEETRPKG